MYLTLPYQTGSQWNASVVIKPYGFEWPWNDLDVSCRRWKSRKATTASTSFDTWKRRGAGKPAKWRRSTMRNFLTAEFPNACRRCSTWSNCCGNSSPQITQSLFSSTAGQYIVIDHYVVTHCWLKRYVVCGRRFRIPAKGSLHCIWI